MEFITESPLIYIISFLFVLTIVVFFHELGHFWIARLCGVRVDTFSVGFGRELIGWTDKHQTRWKISWLPLGGYVKFFGDEGAASTPDSDGLKSMSDEDRAVSFHFKPLWQRAAVVSAGPIANFILAILIFAAIFTFVGKWHTPAMVDAINPGSPAEAAGFQIGDEVVEIAGEKIENFADLQRIVMVSPGQELQIKVVRDGEVRTLFATPELKEYEDRLGNVHERGLLGITRQYSDDEYEIIRYDPATAVWMGVKETWFIVEQTFVYIGRMVTGEASADQLGGPLRIAQVSGQVAQLGIGALINLTAILSVSIGLINLFPIPMLDGGHLLYYGVEAVRGRPLAEKTQEFGFRIGFALVITLMVFVTWNDLVSLRVVDFIAGIFS